MGLRAGAADPGDWMDYFISSGPCLMECTKFHINLPQDEVPSSFRSTSELFFF